MPSLWRQPQLDHPHQLRPMRDARRHAIDVLKVLLGLLGLYILSSSLYGTLENYSPAQFRDQWDGGVGFYLEVNKGNYWAFWHQHNEHRILFSKLFFYADFRWLGGRNIGTIGANWLMLSANAALLVVLAVRRREASWTDLSFCFGLVLALCCSWTQYENLVCGFQSQFFAVYFFALSSFYAVLRSTESPSASWRYIVLAAVCGTASALSMASGLFALPMAFAFAAWMRVGVRRLLFLLLATCVVWCLYLSDYHLVFGPGTLREALLHRTIDILRFVALYLGSPVFFITLNQWHAGVFGVALFIACSATVVQVIRRRERDTGAVLSAMLVFLVGTAFLTGAGRIPLGVGTALSSRYCTTALIIAACLLLYYLRRMPPRDPRIVTAVTLVVFLLSIGQNSARSHHDWAYLRDLGALAARLGVFDDNVIANIYPRTSRVEELMQQASREAVHFGEQELAPMRSVFSSTSVTCLGRIERVDATSSPDHLQVSGWIYAKDRGEVPHRLLLTDTENRVVGEAVSGHARPDVVRALG